MKKLLSSDCIWNEIKIIGDEMNRKLITIGLSKMALLTALVIVSVFINTRSAFAQESNSHPQVVLADWVPMSASSNIKPPSAQQVYKALQKCLREGSIGSSEFAYCFTREIGLATWNANYAYIICTIKWYTGDKSFCGNCFTKEAGWLTPCDSRCKVQNACVTCCKLAGEKVKIEGHPSNYDMTVTQCMLDHDCAGSV